MSWKRIRDEKPKDKQDVMMVKNGQQHVRIAVFHEDNTWRPWCRLSFLEKTRSLASESNPKDWLECHEDDRWESLDPVDEEETVQNEEDRVGDCLKDNQ